jgi:hypothetical protein
MRNISPTKPSFILGYWRPWKEDSNVIDSYLNYVKDTSLVKYGADTVGTYIKQASDEQIQAINRLGQAIGRGVNILSDKMTELNNTLCIINQNIEIQVQQQNITNLLLHDIAQLLKIPDSEKERQHCIELGLKFFVNAAKNIDLYSDALEEFQKAEKLMKQDYFVLHLIGYIYLFAKNKINPELALDYFERAAKYASVDSDKNSILVENILANNYNSNNSRKKIGLLASNCYEKAAFSSYILGRFGLSVDYQKRALKFNNTSQNRFLLSKYQIRNGELASALKNLEKCIDNDPNYLLASFKELDLINDINVANLIQKKNDEINSKIIELIDKWKNIESKLARSIVGKLEGLSKQSFEVKVQEYYKYENQAIEIDTSLIKKYKEIDDYIEEIKTTKYVSYSSKKIKSTIDELSKAKDLNYEEICVVFDKIKNMLEEDKLKIGSEYKGGIVFYLDSTGEHGFVHCKQDIGKAIWGSRGPINLIKNSNIIEFQKHKDYGYHNTKKIVELASWFKKTFFFLNEKPAPTAARLCLELNLNGYKGWYLPTLKQLELIHKSISSTNRWRQIKEGWYWSCNIPVYNNYDNDKYGIEPFENKEALGYDIFHGISSERLKIERGEYCHVLPVRNF